MCIKIHDIVKLKSDKVGLKKGDVGTIVYILPDSYEAEFLSKGNYVVVNLTEEDFITFLET